jgi:hypothetical protein
VAFDYDAYERKIRKQWSAVIEAHYMRRVDAAGNIRWVERTADSLKPSELHVECERPE